MLKPGKFKAIDRSMIVKLMSRLKKSQIVRARFSLPKPTSNSDPSIYINESLTPFRRTLYYQLRQLRKKHKTAFKQLYTQDRKITIKLAATDDHEYFITNLSDLDEFLKVSPALEDTYRELFGTSASVDVIYTFIPLAPSCTALLQFSLYSCSNN